MLRDFKVGPQTRSQRREREVLMMLSIQIEVPAGNTDNQRPIVTQCSPQRAHKISHLFERHMLESFNQGNYLEPLGDRPGSNDMVVLPFRQT